MPWAAPLDSLSHILAEIRALRPEPILSSATVMARRTIAIECDDRALFGEFFTMFGAPDPVPGPSDAPADMHLRIRSKTGLEFGWFDLGGTDTLPLDGMEFRFSVTLDTGFFEIFEQPEAAWTCFAFRGAKLPAFAFNGRDCLFLLEPRWRSNIMWLLFWRLLRIRTDAIFFHAAALGMSGQGTMLVGPSGGGKSTTAMALAARGHAFLSDEVAAYEPATGQLCPFRRPVGIKPGPRSEAVQSRLPREELDRIERDGFARLDIGTILPVEDAGPVPLRNIVFLRGFADTPSLARISPGRNEIGELQPLMSSFLNASHARRIFELTRLLSASNVYELRLGGPDETAAYLEQAIA